MEPERHTTKSERLRAEAGTGDAGTEPSSLYSNAPSPPRPLSAGCTPHRVVIVGGGFGGLYAARRLRGAPVQVTLVDRRNFHLFQPLLYQVATGGLSPADIAAPLRGVLRRQRNVTVLMGEVVGFDL